MSDAYPPPAPKPFAVLAGGALLMLPVGAIYSWSLFYQTVEADLGVGRAALAGVFAVGSLSFALTMLIAPALVRGMAAWRVALAAGLVTAAGHVLAGTMGTLWALYLGCGVLYGGASGFAYSAALQASVLAWRRRQGLATGIAVCSGALGSIVSAPLYRVAILAIGPWQTLVWSGAVYAALALSAAVLMRGVDLPRQHRLHLASPADSRRARRIEAMLWLGFFFGASAGLMALGHSAAIALAYGGALAPVALATALITAGNGLGRIGAGWISDHVPVGRVLIAAPALGALALFALAAWPSIGTALVVLALVGLAYGSMAAGYPAACGRYFGVERVGATYGRVFTAWGAAGFVAPSVAGYLFDRAGGYGLPVILAGCAALASAAVAALLPRAPYSAALRPEPASGTP